MASAGGSRLTEGRTSVLKVRFGLSGAGTLAVEVATTARRGRRLRRLFAVGGDISLDLEGGGSCAPIRGGGRRSRGLRLGFVRELLTVARPRRGVLTQTSLYLLWRRIGRRHAGAVGAAAPSCCDRRVDFRQAFN